MKRENIIDALDMIDEELLNNAMNYREQKKARRFSFSKLAAIAAAAVLVISATVMTATATYRFEVDPQDARNAVNTAYLYAVYHADTRDDYDFLVYCWEEYRYDETVEGKMTGLRPVINVCFKAAGHAYDIDVDAKAGIVTRCKVKTDPDWDAHFDDYEGYEKAHTNWLIAIGEKEPEVTVGDINGVTAFSIFKDYFGIGYLCNTVGSYITSTPTVSVFDYTTDPMTIPMSYEHDGYIYECRINSVTGEVTEANVIEVPAENLAYPSNKHRHDHDDNPEFIGSYEVNLIALEALGLSPEAEDYWSHEPALYVIDEYGGGRLKANGDPIDLPEGVDAYYFWTKHFADAPDINIIIDAKTGEIYLIEESDEYTTYYEGGITLNAPSAEAPEGMISDADVLIIILEDLGFNKKDDLHGFEIELVDGVYEVTAGYNDREWTLWKSYYSVDAVSGEILEKTVEKWPLES